MIALTIFSLAILCIKIYSCKLKSSKSGISCRVMYHRHVRECGLKKCYCHKSPGVMGKQVFLFKMSCLFSQVINSGKKHLQFYCLCLYTSASSLFLHLGMKTVQGYKDNLQHIATMHLWISCQARKSHANKVSLVLLT